MITLDALLQDASSFVKSEFNLDIEKSQLKLYSSKNWMKFYEANKNSIFGFSKDDYSLFVPSSCCAYVRTDNSFLISNILHELYGHGLFVEHSKIGKQLVDIIQNKEDEKTFMFDEVDKQLFGIAKYNIQNYEGFAIWLESLLCQETGNNKLFNKKKDSLNIDNLHLLDYFNQAEKNLSRFGLVSQMGFPKFYDDEKVLEVTKKLYGSFDNFNFIVLYGSQKPESDIDLFIVSNNNSANYFNGWLDIYELNKNEFIDLSKKLDISITDPIFSGRLIQGDKTYFEKIKKQIQEEPITQEAIDYNLREAKRLKDFDSQTPHQEKMRKNYIRSFSQNLEQLKLGNKALTLNRLNKIYENDVS